MKEERRMKEGGLRQLLPMSSLYRKGIYLRNRSVIVIYYIY